MELKERFENLLQEFAQSGMEPQAFLDSLPLHRIGGWGGNTLCVRVRCGDSDLIIDGGSGIRPVGYDLMSGPCGRGEGEVHLFFTHFHWDHLVGLPFFTPIFIPGNKIHVYSVQPEVEEVFRTVFRKPYFPVAYEDLGAQFVYHRLEPRKPHAHGEILMTPYQLDHPDPCWGFRVEGAGRSYAHCVDTECTRISREQLGPDLPLYQGVDLMLFDAQYTLMETVEKVNWGHAAASLGLDLALRERIPRVLFLHHEPASSDEKVAQAELEARRYYEGQLKASKRLGEEPFEVDWEFAQEGTQIRV